MKRYMLDTNIISHLIKEHTVVTQRIVEVPMEQLCISSITAGELIFGLAKRPNAKRLHNAVREFFKCVNVLSWNESTAEHYGLIRAELEQLGTMLAPLDLLIATHALAEDAVLVTNDRAFSRITSLHIEDWTNAH